MDESTCANEAPTSPRWARAAFAAVAGAAAGLAFGRKGAVGLLTAMTAAAGAKMLAQACRGHDGDHADDFVNEDMSPLAMPHAPTEVLPPEEPPLPATPPQEDRPDWIDHDAVQFSHVVPDETAAAEMLKEKELPLLDDDGLPADHVTVQPAYPEAPEKRLEEGPLIWEPGRFIQTRSDSTSATVWFGLHDATPPPAKPAPAHEPQAAPAAAAEPEAEPAPQPELIPSAAAQSHVITPKNTTRTALPQPRPTAVSPRRQREREREGSPIPPGLRLTSPGMPAVHHTQRVSQLRATGSHRHLEPHAPSSEGPAPVRRWPKMLLLGILVGIAIFLVVDRWTNGTLFQKFGEKFAIEQAMLHSAPPTASAPPVPIQDTKRARFLQPQPAPESDAQADAANR